MDSKFISEFFWIEAFKDNDLNLNFYSNDLKECEIKNIYYYLNLSMNLSFIM